MHWIDLLTWKKLDTNVMMDSWAQGIVIHPDKTHVAIVSSQLTNEREPKLLGYKLTQADISGKGVDLIEVELDTSPRLVAYSGDGSSILVYEVV